MALSDQARELMRQGAEMRQQTFGVDSRGETQTGRYDNRAESFACYFTPVRDQEQLDAAGFRDVHDAIVRFFKSSVPFVPEIGKLIRLVNASPAGDIVLRIAEFGASGLNPEYVLGCKAAF